MCLTRHEFAETPKVQALRTDNELTTRLLHSSSNRQLCPSISLPNTRKHFTRTNQLRYSNPFSSHSATVLIVCSAQPRHQHLFLFGPNYHFDLGEDNTNSQLAHIIRHRFVHSTTTGSVRDRIERARYTTIKIQYCLAEGGDRGSRGTQELWSSGVWRGRE